MGQALSPGRSGKGGREHDLRESRWRTGSKTQGQKVWYGVRLTRAGDPAETCCPVLPDQAQIAGRAFLSLVPPSVHGLAAEKIIEPKLTFGKSESPGRWPLLLPHSWDSQVLTITSSSYTLLLSSPVGMVPGPFHVKRLGMTRVPAP